MKKRTFLLTLLAILFITIGYNITVSTNKALLKEHTELEEAYTKLKKEYAKEEEKYAELGKDYAEIEKENAQLKESIEKIQNLPDIEVHLIDDHNEVIELTPCNSFALANENATEYYLKPDQSDMDATKFYVTINTDATEVDILWFYGNGEIRSIMDRVGNVDNVYSFNMNTFDPIGCDNRSTFIIKIDGKLVYTSIFYSH